MRGLVPDRSHRRQNDLDADDTSRADDPTGQATLSAVASRPSDGGDLTLQSGELADEVATSEPSGVVYTMAGPPC